MKVLQRWLPNRGPAPAITHYGADGSRVELSGATAANAVAKAVNLFRDELLLEPGDIVWLDVPLHWQVPVLAMATWAGGLTLAIGAPPAAAAATLGTGRNPAVGIPLAVSEHPWGLPLGAATPPGWEDLAALTRPQPDRASLGWPPESEPWLMDGPETATGSALLHQARDLGRRWALAPGGRLVTALRASAKPGLLAQTLVPAVAGGSVILATPGALATILRQEGSASVATNV